MLMRIDCEDSLKRRENINLTFNFPKMCRKWIWPCSVFQTKINYSPQAVHETGQLQVHISVDEKKQYIFKVVPTWHILLNHDGLSTLFFCPGKSAWHLQEELTAVSLLSLQPDPSLARTIFYCDAAEIFDLIDWAVSLFIRLTGPQLTRPPAYLFTSSVCSEQLFTIFLLI